MQRELEGEIDLQLLAVNRIGYDGVGGMAARGDLPLLQDRPEVDAWSSWSAAYRDVIVLDADNRRVGVFNLTVNDLAVPENREALKALLRSAASR